MCLLIFFLDHTWGKKLVVKMKKIKRYNIKRPTKDKYYLNIAREVARRSTCLRRAFGAVIVNRDQIVSTGYGGAPRQTINCISIGICLRDQLKVKPGEKYELCRSVHAEQNAIIHSSRLDMIGATLYLVGLDYKTKKILNNAEPCRMCKRMIINAGINKVVIQNSRRIRGFEVSEWIGSNLNEFEEKGGKLVPRMAEGY